MNHYENHVNDYSKSGQDKAGARNTFLAVVVCVVACVIYFSKYADYSLSDLRHIVTQWSEANNQKQEKVIQKQNESLTAKEDSERKQNLDNSEKEATKVPLKDGKQRIFLNVGRCHGAKKTDLLRVIEKETGVKKNNIHDLV